MSRYAALISVPQLAAELKNPSWRIVDCRFDLSDAAQGMRDYRRDHVPGAIYAHLDNDLAAPVTAQSGRHPLPPVAEFVTTLERLGISSHHQVVAYDAAAGAMAARLWWMLRWLGHEAVAVLDGGYAAWLAAGQPVESQVPACRPARFEPHEQTDWVLSTTELARALHAGDAPALVDAREEARYEGREEPIDDVAGRIPGAMNFPYTQNVDGLGGWRSAGDVRAAWRTLFPGGPPDGWAVMCGSGVTACHLALSAEVAGLVPPRLYAGSWSEWIRDPGRPRVP